MKRDLPTQITTDITSQQLFDYITHFLYKQGEPSVDRVDRGSEVCAYRGTRGLMCAVGCIIPDEIYRERMEGSGVTELEIKARHIPVHKPYWDWVMKHTDLLCSLQTIHDNLYYIKGAGRLHIRKAMLRGFLEVAESHLLEFDPKDYKAD
jgi:hypothetical protein